MGCEPGCEGVFAFENKHFVRHEKKLEGTRTAVVSEIAEHRIEHDSVKYDFFGQRAMMYFLPEIYKPSTRDGTLAEKTDVN